MLMVKVLQLLISQGLIVSSLPGTSNHFTYIIVLGSLLLAFLAGAG